MCWFFFSTTPQVLTSDGKIYTWGFGGYGRLGHGDESSVLAELLPRRIEALRSVRAVAVSAGFSHSLAPSAAGEVYSCGDGRFGKLGHGGKERQSPPSAYR